MLRASYCNRNPHKVSLPPEERLVQNGDFSELKPDERKLGQENFMVIRTADIFRKGDSIANPKLMIPYPAPDSYYIQIP